MADHSGQNLSLKWDKQLGTITNFFKMIYETNFVSDVTISVNGGLVRAHRVVLGMCSPYFKDLFSQQPANEPILILPDITLQEIKWLLEFMYIGSVYIDSTDIGNLMRVAEKLQIRGLFKENEPRAMNDVIPRSETPRGFDTQMLSNNPLHPFPVLGTPTSQVQSMLSSVDNARLALSLNPALSLANSIPLHNLVPFPQSFSSSPLLCPPFSKPINSPAKSVIPPMSPSIRKTNKSVPKKRKRRNAESDYVESDNSTISPSGSMEIITNQSTPENTNNNDDDEPTDLTIRSTRKTSPIKTEQSNSYDEEIQKKLSIAYSHSHVAGSSVPLVIDHKSPENFYYNKNSLDKESPSPSLVRPSSSHSGEFRESGEPSFSSNNSEHESPLLKKFKTSLNEEVNNSEEAMYNISNDRVNTLQPEGNAGPSTAENAASYFSALMTAAGIRFPQQAYGPDVIQQNPNLLTLTNYENSTSNRRRQPPKNGEKRYECIKCGRAYASSGNLKRHLKYECGVPPQFRCPKCQKVFQHRHSAKIHVMASHKDDQQLIDDTNSDPSLLTIDSVRNTRVALTDSTPGNLDHSIQSNNRAESEM